MKRDEIDPLKKWLLCDAREALRSGQLAVRLNGNVVRPSDQIHDYPRDCKLRATPEYALSRPAWWEGLAKR